jgi:hypothetical protein
MAQGAGRIVCPRCGANNFDTVSVCWKCSTPLGAAAPPPVPPVMPMPAPSVAAPSPSPAEMYAYRAASAAGLAGNPDTANRAALWLGLLFPYFGLPIALAFMMCDDRRRQEVGRICLLWSLVSSVLHLLLLFVTLLGLRDYFMAFLGAARAGINRSGGMGGGYPGLE